MEAARVTGKRPPIAAAILSAAAPIRRTCLTRRIIASTSGAYGRAFVLSAENDDDVAIERFDGLDRGIHIGGLGVVEELDSVHRCNKFDAMFDTAEIPNRLRHRLAGNAVAVPRPSLPQAHCRCCGRPRNETSATGITGFPSRYRVPPARYAPSSTLWRWLKKRCRAFPADAGGIHLRIIPIQNRDIRRLLVLENPEFRRAIGFEIRVTIQVIGSDVESTRRPWGGISECHPAESC